MEPHRTNDSSSSPDAISLAEVAAEVYAEGGGRAATLLRASRRKAKMTEQALGDAANVQPAHISAMERGQRKVGPRMAQRLAKALTCDWRFLVSE